jgi:hypothetical protein
MIIRRAPGLLLLLIAANLSLAGEEVTPRPQLEQKQGNAAANFFPEKLEGGKALVALSGGVRVTLSVRGPATLEVEPIRKIAEQDAWQVRTLGAPQTVDLGNGTVRWQQDFYLEPLLKPGDQSLQLLPLRFRDKPEGTWQEVRWEPIPIRVTTQVAEPKLSELRDILPPEALPDAPSSPRWWLPLLVGGGLTAVASSLLLASWQLRRRRALWALAVPAHELALHELRQIEALGLPAAGKTERYHTLLSDVIRRYLERRFALRAPRLTTTEFLEAMRQAPQLSPEQQTLLRDFLGRCDLAKFAGVQPPPAECQAALAMARAFVEQTVPVPEPAKK